MTIEKPAAPTPEAPRQMQIDARVALQETTLKADADLAYYRNRVLVLGQTVFELETALKVQAELVEQQQAEIAELKGDDLGEPPRTEH